MSYKLPPRPSFEHIKKQAKYIRKAYRESDPRACDVIRCSRKYSGMSVAEMARENISLREIQHALALAYGCKSWKHLKEMVTKIAKLGVSLPGAGPKQVKSDEIVKNLPQKVDKGACSELMVQKYVFGELDKETRQKVAQHLSKFPECREFK